MPLAFPSSVAVPSFRENANLTCDIDLAQSGVVDGAIVWYRVSNDLLAQLPPDGVDCGGTTTPIPSNNSMVNITGGIVANGSTYELIPVQFGDEGYYVCVIRSRDEQQLCFSNYVTVTGELSSFQ